MSSGTAGKLASVGANPSVTGQEFGSRRKGGVRCFRSSTNRRAPAIPPHQWQRLRQRFYDNVKSGVKVWQRIWFLLAAYASLTYGKSVMRLSSKQSRLRHTKAFAVLGAWDPSTNSVGQTRTSRHRYGSPRGSTAYLY